MNKSIIKIQTRLNFEEADRKCSGAVGGSRTHLFSRWFNCSHRRSEWRRAAGGDITEQLVRPQNGSFLPGRSEFNPQTVQRDEKTPDFCRKDASLPLLERTAWLSFQKKKRACVRARCEGSSDRFMWVYVVFPTIFCTVWV